MSLSEPQPTPPSDSQHLEEISAQEERTRRKMLLGLLVLLLGLCVVLYITVRYIMQPAPLNTLLPVAVAKNITYPPIYKFSITGVSKPSGVAVSADAQRLYVTEGDGERTIKMFNRDGQLIQKFFPPGTSPSNRQPLYVAINPDGRVFVTDNYNHAIDVFDPAGNFIDAIIGEDQTLSKVVAAQNNGVVPLGTVYFYNNIDKKVYYQLPDQDMKSVDADRSKPWVPMGLKFDNQGNLIITMVTNGVDRVVLIPADALKGSWINYNPQVKFFGASGKGDGQFSYPNSAVRDSKGNFYVSDGNNGRLSFWGSDMTYKTFFGFGSDPNSFSLPRGMWIDDKDRLHVADAVGQNIHVYDVSQPEPVFLFSFGDFGISEGMFDYPTDICIDNGGRLYIADRENNRVEIWSY